jgi:hypothetical protein
MNRVNASAGMAVFLGLCVSLGLYIALRLLVFPHASDDTLILLAPTDRYAVLGGFVAGWLYRNSDPLNARSGFLIGAVTALAIEGFLTTVALGFNFNTHHDLVIQLRKWIIPALLVVLAGGVAGIVGSALKRASYSLDTTSAQIEPKPSDATGIGRTLVVVGLIFVTIWSLIWYSARPIVPRNLCGIRLGMTREQVIALKGDRASNTATDTWQYPLNHTRTDVTCSVSFQDGKVVQIVAATESKWGLLRLLERVPMSSGRQGIEDYLGTPTHFYTSGNGSRKILVYENFHAFFVLSLGGDPQYPRDIVERVSIYDPKNVTPGFSQ